MVALSDCAHDEHNTRMLLTAPIEDDSPTIWRLFHRVGALEPLDLLRSGSPLLDGIRPEEGGLVKALVGAQMAGRDIGKLLQARYDDPIPLDLLR